MSTRELIEAEIENLNAEQLDQLYKIVRELSATEKPASAPSLMAKLKQIKIDGPQDFATNADLYASGEKRV